MRIRVLELWSGAALPTETRPAHEVEKHEAYSLLKKEFNRFKTLLIVVLVGSLAICMMVLVGLFAPGLRYSLIAPIAVSIDSEAFLNELEPQINSKITRNNQIEVIENGDHFYEAELQAMREARHSINIEAYIFHKGKLTDEVLQVLTERARAGVHVNLVLDAAGSLSTHKSYFKQLKEAGGKVDWYHRLRLHNWFKLNNRTHREITIIDGSTAFVGGAGYADWWRYGTKSDPRWRDTMVRIRGDAVRAIQGTFLENCLEASGSILNGADYFPQSSGDPAKTTALVVTSTPSRGGSTRARVLFQVLIAGARKSIYITTPYFLPDRSMTDDLVHAAEHGVTVNLIVPGKHDDHALTRSSGRSAYGKLLEAGAKVYEYEPAMIHAKIAIFDGVWSVVGSTNLDNRSFGINDEINVAVLDPQIASTLTHDFEEDAGQSRRVTLEDWKRRPLSERLMETVGWIFEREQ
jgi:cardiolipin synthase A/B